MPMVRYNLTMSSTPATKQDKHCASANGVEIARKAGDPLPDQIPNHPLAPLAGCFENEPLWKDLMEEVQKYRKKMDEIEEEEDAA